MRPRVQMLETLRVAIQAARGGRYHVKRGYVDWTAHDYRVHPFPVSIMVDVETQGTIGDTEALLSVVAACSIPEPAPVEIDDERVQDLIDDVRAAFAALEQSTVAGADGPVVFRLDWKGARLTEWHDVDLRLQGILLQVQVSY